jgi:hypothetical protein
MGFDGSGPQGFSDGVVDFQGYFHCFIQQIEYFFFCLKQKGIYNRFIDTFNNAVI